MSMLAGPRRKRHYNLVPRGKPLFEDSDRFGTKMLEKMGWSMGKGLGSREDGKQEFVRVHYKNDTNGLGFQDRDDQWTEHEKHFDGLLETLNGGDSTTNSVSDGRGFGFKAKKKEKLTEKLSGQSLEEKSKNSKARVHYKKFTKGKDIAQYSEKDLANIFGKKASKDDENIYSQFNAFNTGADEEKTKEEQTTSESSMINTGVSVSDYFKMKKDALRAKKGGAVENGNAEETFAEDAPTIKKKSKQQSDDSESKQSSANPPKELGTQIVSTGVSVADYFKTQMEALKQKKAALGIEIAVEDNTTVKKQKIKQKSIKDESEESGVAVEDVEVHKKRKKNKKQEILVEQSPSVVEEVPAETASKKNKKNKNTSVIPAEEESCQKSVSSQSLEEKSKNSKARVQSKNFTSGKDKAQYSENDLDNSFGKKENINSQFKAFNGGPNEEFTKEKRGKQEDSCQESLSEEQDDAAPSVDEIPRKKKEKRTNKIEIQTEDQPLYKKVKKQQAPTEILETNSFFKPSKKKDNNKVSSQQNLTHPSKDNRLPDTYTISTFCAEKFRNVELHQFHESNLSQINGYGFGDDLQLEIKMIKNDQERIMRLWSGTLDKYHHATPKHKIYSNYMTKAKEARRTKNVIPQIKVKCLKRKHVFQSL